MATPPAAPQPAPAQPPAPKPVSAVPSKQAKPNVKLFYIGVVLVVAGLGYAVYKVVTAPPPKAAPAAKAKH